jgi:hypothetical protein
MQRRCGVCGVLAFSIVSLMLTLRPAIALDKIKVGVPSTEAFSFMAVDFGNDLGLYAKNGVGGEKEERSRRGPPIFCRDEDPSIARRI